MEKREKKGRGERAKRKTGRAKRETEEGRRGEGENERRPTRVQVNSLPLSEYDDERGGEWGRGGRERVRVREGRGGRGEEEGWVKKGRRKGE